MSHLDEMTLEKVLLEATPAPAHLESCSDCASRLAQMRQENEDFRRFVFPATIDKVTESQARRPWWMWTMVPVIVGAAAAVTVLLRAPTEPGVDYIGVKGNPLKLSVYTLDATGAAQRLDDGAKVKASAVLRFQVAPVKPCYLFVLSVDGAGVVSRLYPAQGDAVLVGQSAALPGGATLDGQGGPERVFAICSPKALPWDAVAGAARAATPEAVRGLRSLSLEPAAAQATVLLEKQP